MRESEIPEKIRIAKSFLGIGFRTMADGRNAIENTRAYTSDMKDSSKKYYGRGGNGGFICENGMYNQFIDLAKQDGKWDNRFIGNKFIESYKVQVDSDELASWKGGKRDMIIRLFIKEIGGSKYVGRGIYYYSGSSQTGVMWTQLNQ
jgi:hypothetical protein